MTNPYSESVDLYSYRVDQALRKVLHADESDFDAALTELSLWAKRWQVASAMERDHVSQARAGVVG